MVTSLHHKNPWHRDNGSWCGLRFGIWKPHPYPCDLWPWHRSFTHIPYALLSCLTLMTPHTIAYVAIQVCHNDFTVLSFLWHLTYHTEEAHFAMSLTSTWANINGPFSYSDFYWQIVGLFEDEEEAAVIIKFYNQYVPLFNILCLCNWLFSFCVATYLEWFLLSYNQWGIKIIIFLLLKA